jgi:hypothetical protein
MAVRKDQIQITLDIEAQQGVRSYQKLLDQTKQVNAEMRKLKRQGKQNTDEFKALEKQATKLNIELKELGGAGANMGQLISRSRQLNREIKSLVPGTKRFIAATEELKGVNSRLADIRKQTKGVASGMDEVNQKGLNMPPVLNKISGAMKGFLALAIVQFFVRLVDVLDTTTKQFRKLRGEVEQATGATGSALDEYTGRVSAIAGTFEKETSEVLQAANALTKQLTGDFSQSLDLIEKGFLAGADRSGEFLSVIKEYPAFFREAELSGEQFIGLISQGVQEGVFSDKSVDLLKEFTLRIRELTPVTQKALEGIGITSEQIAKEIDDKGIGGAFQLVQERLKEIEDTAPETGAVLADVFGGPGEDAGIQFIENLQLTDEALNSLIDTGNDYTAALVDQLQANEELAQAQNRVSQGFNDTSNSLSVYIARIKAFLFNVAADVLEFFEELPATASGVQAAFRQILKNIQGFFERTRLGLTVTLKRIEKLNPFGKTSEQLDNEIAALRDKQGEISDAAGSVAKAYREAFLAGLEDVERRKEISEKLLPQPTEDEVQNTAERNAKLYLDKEAAALAKLKAERAKDRNTLQPLQAIVATNSGSVSSTGEGEGNISAQEERLKNQFLKALITEQEYEDQRFELQQAAYDRRLEYIRRIQGEESAAFIALENKKLESQRTYEDQRAELTRRTEEARRVAMQEGVNALSGFVEDTIGFLQDEEGARKKGGLALKAFSIGKVLIDTQEAIMAITKNAQANPSNILFPGSGDLIAGLKIASVLARSTSSLAKIRGTSFYSGGYTGTGVIVPDQHGGIVGGVHKDEWVAPAWMAKDSPYSGIISWLEGVRQNGYKDGGFVDVDTSSIASSTTTPSPILNTQQLEAMMMKVVQSNLAVESAIMAKQFSVPSGQIVDALEEEARLSNNSSF